MPLLSPVSIPTELGSLYRGTFKWNLLSATSYFVLETQHKAVWEQGHTFPLCCGQGDEMNFLSTHRVSLWNHAEKSRRERKKFNQVGHREELEDDRGQLTSPSFHLWLLYSHSSVSVTWCCYYRPWKTGTRNKWLCQMGPRLWRKGILGDAYKNNWIKIWKCCVTPTN